MKQLNSKFNFLYLIILFCLLAISIQAQTKELISEKQSPAVKTFEEWKTKNLPKNLFNSEYRYRGIGVSVTKIENHGITLEAIVGVSSDYGYLSPMEFTVQPLAKSDSKSSTLVEAGVPTTLKTPLITNENIAEFRINPKISITTPPNIYAVEIKVTGLFSDTNSISNVKLLVKDTVTVGSLGVIITPSETGKCKTNQRKQPVKDSLLNITKASYSLASENVVDKYLNSDPFSCLWYTGSCGYPCNDPLCGECNNASPHLNCTSCKMECGGSGECPGGAGPKPSQCP